MSVLDKIKVLSRQLYPTGRAFKMPVGSFFEKLNTGLAQGEKRFYDDALSTLDSAIPDNSDFTADDATDWERRLGLITNDAVSLENRKLAIIRKMNHPGAIPARQHYLYLQGQLQAAGFDVYVFENRFPSYGGTYDTQTPQEVTGSSAVGIQHGDAQHGDFQHGTELFDIVANSLDPDIDAVFNIGSSLRCTFFIGGNPLGTFADVDVERETEFRQLILKIKPVQTVAYLFINYV